MKNTDCRQLAYDLFVGEFAAALVEFDGNATAVINDFVSNHKHLTGHNERELTAFARAMISRAEPTYFSLKKRKSGSKGEPQFAARV